MLHHKRHKERHKRQENQLSKSNFYNYNLQANKDDAKTASNGAKGVMHFTASGQILCIEEPSRIGATTT